jgi:hypothetical protein
MGIGLVPDIPDKTVVRSIEDIMQGQGQLDYPQPGSEVTTGLGYRMYEEAA